MSEQQINLSVTVNEANVILNALAQLPYAQVSTLIGKLQQQGSSQVVPQVTPEAAQVVVE
jgi:hypothetical protein